MRSLAGAALCAALALGAGGCSRDAAQLPSDGASTDHVPYKIPPGIGTPPVAIGPHKIQHVIFVIQENRSFDDIFGGLDPKGNPFPGADTVSNPLPGEPTPHDHLGNPVKMMVGALAQCYSAAHDRPQAIGEIRRGKMDGFDLEDVSRLGCAQASPPPDYVYQTVKYSDVTPYWEIGEQYATSDRMFESLLSSSFAAHLYLVAGQSANTVDYPTKTPWGCDSKPGSTTSIIDDATGQSASGPFPCYTWPSFVDVLDAQKISWRYYAASVRDYGYLWSSLDAFSRIRNGPEWSTNVVTPPSQFLTDVGNGNLAAMTWVTPTNATSDHPVAHSSLGPAWVASVVDAVGDSPFWNSSAVIVTWDDWGGWYDHVPPPSFNALGYGLRVPLIVVSPYAKLAYVSHTVHSFGSMLHFAEEMLGAASLGKEDAFDDDLSDMFDFSQAPTAFQPFVIKKGDRERARRAASIVNGPPPDDD